MVTLKRWLWKGALPLAIMALALGVGSVRHLLRTPSTDRPLPTLQTASASASPLPLVGTGSCSARGCHGGIEPVTDATQCRQTEYVEWARDRHADAFRTLFNERSQRIAKLMGSSKHAHEDPRCLACHTNPLLAALPSDSLFVRKEQLFGVGCESCHGSASQWLVAHTAADWRSKKPRFSMPDLADPSVHARLCVGCHVGAPADGALPARDVNHDMIAAGHPRLNFEFGAYEANMPAHWRPRKKATGDHWAVGQLVTAQAALELLTHRASAGPWPEFAEYDCFSCHRSLAHTSLRPKGIRNDGLLHWGSWYFALTRSQMGPSPVESLDRLEAVMKQPRPDRIQALAQARSALAELQRFRAPSRLSDQQRLSAIALDNRLSDEPSWDAVEQVYLALLALNAEKAFPQAASVLSDLEPIRAFAPGFEGPISWPRVGNARFDMKQIMERIR